MPTPIIRSSTLSTRTTSATSAEALQRITAECLVVGISTDLIFTVPEMQALHRMLPRSTYHQIDSPFGHDGFLVEHEQLNRILNPFIHPTHE